jgi:hypothetical protein
LLESTPSARSNLGPCPCWWLVAGCRGRGEGGAAAAAGSRAALFEADLYDAASYVQAVAGCQFIFLVAMLSTHEAAASKATLVKQMVGRGTTRRWRWQRRRPCRLLRLVQNRALFQCFHVFAASPTDCSGFFTNKVLSSDQFVACAFQEIFPHNFLLCAVMGKVSRTDDNTDVIPHLLIN